jgi:hypothetical protein
MGNFLQDVGRSRFESSIKDMINTKLSLDASERADVQSANASALSAEQLIQAKRQNEAAAERVKYDNTPLAINSFSDSIEGGPEGPIFKHLYSRAKSQGLIDESNPNNPTIKRKYINEDMQKIFTQDAMQINNMRIDMLNSQKQALIAEKAKKPEDEKINAAIESVNVKLNQATMHDDGLKEMEKLKNQAAIQESHDRRALETAKIQAEATIKGHQISADAVRDAAREKALNDIKNDPTLKMSKDEKWAVDFLKTYKENSQPSVIDALLASTQGKDSPAMQALIDKQKQNLSPDTQAKVKKAQAIVDKMLKKNNPELFEEPSSGIPEGLTEADIQYNMTNYGKSREEVIAKFNKSKGVH